MSWQRFILLCFGLLIYHPILALDDGKLLCPRLILVGHVPLTSTEKTLVCGAPNVPAWDNIPDSQAVFHLKTFLQNRGFYSPVVSERDGKLVVRIGEQTRVRTFEVRGEPEEIHTERIRRVEGEVLTPELLDETKARLLRRLEAHGYPCGTVEVEAAYATGRLRAVVNPGPRLTVSDVSIQETGEFHSEVLARYYAFEPGALFNGDLLGLTVGRTLRDGIVQSTHFTQDCKTTKSETGIAIKQGFVEGPARLVSFGFGLDTERGPILRGSWKNGRLGATGSQLHFALNTSWREQELTGESRWYVLEHASRFYLNPSFLVRHDREEHFENYLARLSLAPATTWDDSNFGLRTFLGPTLNYVRTVVGAGAGENVFMSLRGELSLEEHSFEIHRTNPREGLYARLETDVTIRNALSPVNAQMVRLRVQKNWNLGNFDPPFLIWSLRGGAASTLTDEDVSGTALPSPYRHFLGGSTDLRGFGRQELPGPGGALTTAFAGAEARFADLLPWGLQPILFLDAGLLGARPFSLNSTLYYSPGFGMRWQTKIGVIRSTLARGWIADRDAAFGSKPEHIQLYFSFGEEF